jgi:RND family efflux transporter MFP subunit
VSRGKIIAGIVGLVVVGAIIAGVVMSAQNAAPLVKVEKAAKETLGVIVTASGKVEAGNKADVFPASAGLIESVDVSDGATVTAGQALATLDSAAAHLQVTQAEAGLKAAQSQLDQVRKSAAAAIDTAAANAGVSAAQRGYEAALQAFPYVTHSADATYSNLLVGVTNADAAAKNAYAGLQSAKSAQNKLKVNAKPTAALAAASAGVDQAQAALKLARDGVTKTTITSPMDGVVIFNPLGAPGADGTTPKAAKGAAVSPQAAPFTVVAFGTLNFDAQVDEADVDRVKSGMAAKVRLDAFPSDSIDAKVVTIKSAAVQTTTGGIAFPVLLSISAPGKNVLLGMSGSVDIEVSAVSDAITVPIESVLDEEGKKFVFVVKDGKAVKTAVTTGALTDTRAQVLEGLDAGAEVAVGSLKDGMTVRTK